MSARGPCLIHCPKKSGGAGVVVAVVIGVLALARAGAVVHLVEVAAQVIVIAVASVAALLVAFVAVRVAVRVRARRRQRRLLALPAAVHYAATVQASLAIEAPADAVVPGDVLYRTAAQAPITHAAVRVQAVAAGSKRASMTEPI